MTSEPDTEGIPESSSTTPEKPPSQGTWLMKFGIALFGTGVFAALIVFIMFAMGLRNLPVWLSIAAGVITPLGLALGLIALVREARQKNHV